MSLLNLKQKTNSILALNFDSNSKGESARPLISIVIKSYRKFPKLASVLIAQIKEVKSRAHLRFVLVAKTALPATL